MPDEVPADNAPPRRPGEILRAARLRRRVSLAEAEQATRIRQRYLEAIEEDNYSALPAGVYSWGFVRNYAIFLGVPPESVAPENQGRPRGEPRLGVRSVARPMRVSSPQSIWLYAAAGVVALVLLALVWLGLTAPAEQTPTQAAGTAGAPAPSATSRVTLPPLAPASTPGAAAPAGQSGAPRPAPATSTPPLVPTATSAARPGQVEVDLRTVERAWVRATVDGKIVLEETLEVGQSRRWVGQNVALRVGNGGGVDVSVNGQRIGALGPAGAPADREFTR